MSKGKSAIQQKAEYQRRQSYTPAQRMNYESCECDSLSGKRFIPQALLDRIADEKFSGGFKISRKNVCEKCYQAKSVNGSCGCDE